MDYIVVSFRSRLTAIKFSEILNNFNIRNEIVNTPKEAGVGCGLSVKVSKNEYANLKRIIERYNLTGANLFLVTVRAGKRFVKSI